MELKQTRRVKRVMRKLPNDPDKIEQHIGSHPNLTKLLCDFFGCNEKVLPYRIIGWKTTGF